MASYRDLQHRLVALTCAHPQAQVAEQRRRHAELLAQSEALTRDEENKRGEREALAEQIDTLVHERTVLGERLPQLGEDLAALKPWVELEAAEEHLRSRLEELPGLVAARAAEEEGLGRTLAELGEAEGKLHADAARWRADAGNLKDEAARYEEQAEGDPGLAGQSLEQLRAIYAERAMRYQVKTADSVLSERLRQKSERAGQIEQDLAASSPELLERARTLTQSAEAASRHQRQAASQAAERSRAHAQGLYNQAHELFLAQRRKREELPRPTLTEPLPAEPGLDQLGELLESERRRMEPRIGQINANLGVQRPRLGPLGERVTWLHASASRLDEFEGELTVSEPFSGDHAEAHEQIRAIVRADKDLTERREQSKSHSGRLARQVMQLAGRPEYASMRTLQARFQELPEDRERGQYLLTQIRQRLPVLQADLEQFARDHELVAERLYQNLRAAYHNLELAEEASRLPEGLPGWSGIPFISIGFEAPKQKERWQAVCAKVIDEFVQRPDQLSGMNLLWAVVRGANARGKFKVSMLQPDALLTSQRYEIEEIKFSEGQDLTAAILLYCTFVNLRARNQRGRRKETSSGTLVLDNPTGKASLAQLIDLQLRVAASTGVHLVITTHIHDPEVLARYPGRIALRPAPAANSNTVYLVDAGLDAARVQTLPEALP